MARELAPAHLERLTATETEMTDSVLMRSISIVSPKHVGALLVDRECLDCRNKPELDNSSAFS